MPTWDYDSYCNDNVFDYLEEFNMKELFSRVEDDMNDYYYHEFSEADQEFIIGVSIYCIRKGKKFSVDFLNKLVIVIDYLLENGKFNGWKNTDKRKKKLNQEKLIIKSIIQNKKIIFKDIIQQPDDFIDLNSNY